MFLKMVPVNLIRDYEAKNPTATLEENKVPNASKIMAIRVVDMFLSLTKSEGFGLLERLISLEMSHLA